MKNALLAGFAALSLTSGIAAAQTASSTTTTSQYTAPAAPAPVAPPPVGTLSTTRETKAVDAYGNTAKSTTSTYRNSEGVAADSRTTTTTMPVPPVTTSTNTTRTTTEVK